MLASANQLGSLRCRHGSRTAGHARPAPELSGGAARGRRAAGARVICYQAAGPEGDGGVAAAARRRLQQQLAGGRQRADADAAAPAAGEDAAEWEPDAPAPAAPAPPRAAAVGGAAPRRLAPQGWSDDAPPEVTASVAIMPRKAMALACLGKKREDPITLFFAKCKLAW